jgi:hypothetical protein
MLILLLCHNKNNWTLEYVSSDKAVFLCFIWIKEKVI